MNEPITYLGIDVAKAKFDVCLLSTEERCLGQHSFDNTPGGFQKLLDWLGKLKLKKIHACMEATGCYGQALAEFLFSQGLLVSVVNPALIKGCGQAIALRTKTDRADARLIAAFAVKHKPRAWTPPPAEQVQLRALVRRLGDLQTLQQQEQNRLEGADELVQASIKKLLQYLKKQIKELSAQIKALCEQHPSLQKQVELLRSIDGIGWLTAVRVLSELPPVKEFASARQAAAYAGLSPRHHESGSSVRRATRLCKQGNRSLRRALYMPAMTAIQYNPVIQKFAQRLRERGKAPKAIIGAVMRKLLHIIFGVLKHSTAFDPNWGEKPTPGGCEPDSSRPELATAKITQ
jgi:transposase